MYHASLRASSPIWVSEVSLARTRERRDRGKESSSLPSPARRGFAARSRVLARLASLAQIGELARRLVPCVSSIAIRLHSIIGFRRRTGEGVHASKLGGREGETAVLAVYFQTITTCILSSRLFM